MNRFQLSKIDTESLLILKEDVSKELAFRFKTGRVESRRKFMASLMPPEFVSLDDVKSHNASGPLLPPRFGKLDGANLARYLPALWDQDWSSIFPESEATDERFYVYAHVDPSGSCVVAERRCGGNFGGMPFYIGKGTGNRAYDLKRNQAHGKRIKSVLDQGFNPDDIVKIVADGLTSSKALEIESKLILLFGTEYETPKGSLVNLDVPPRPEPTGHMVRYKSKKHWKAGWMLDMPDLAETGVA